MQLRKCILAILAVVSTMTLWCGATFADVPADSALATGVEKAQTYGLMNGYSDTLFGYSDSMTRGQFVTVLSRMMGWSYQESDPLPAATDIETSHYYPFIVAAAQQDVFDMTAPTFRPNDAITRAEMCELLVRGLGLKSAAILEQQTPLPFTDVSGDTGYIAVAYDIGMTKGTSATTFSPTATATRAQAATMLVRIHEKRSQQSTLTHGFYAISGYSQLDYAQTMDVISLGWSRMTWQNNTALLSTTVANNNEYAIPGGYTQVLAQLDKHAIHLSIYMDTANGMTQMLSTSEGRSQAIAQITNELTIPYQAYGDNPYDGVTVDFEGLRLAQKADFTTFIQALSTQVHALGKTIYVCVSPTLTTGPYYDGYDYTALSACTDGVILMAYNYESTNLAGFEGTTYYKNTASAPIDQVYASLSDLVAEMDREKAILGLSFKYIAWEIDQDDKLLSPTPIYPTLDTVKTRLAQETTQLGWSNTYQAPYAIYETEDGGRYFLWYENQESIAIKLDTAKLLGVTQRSIWRLGLIPWA